MSSLKKVTQKGFTIVELLIVIVVIGILAALVITTYNGIQQKGRNTERQTDAKALQGQLEAYYAQNGGYPADGAMTETFIGTSMKGLDKEALRDPKAAVGAFTLGTAASANQYGYDAAPDGCTTAANDCVSYTLTYREEGKSTNTEVKSLN
jgi:prepilin-type N-terminal cleavage/methylation domain-containing protein